MKKNCQTFKTDVERMYVGKKHAQEVRSVICLEKYGKISKERITAIKCSMTKHSFNIIYYSVV